ncbi:hypothetical protein PIB30_067909 [Stylosanthes scabra]|uniref:DRBM domain-containing protein n=1 Tax=Stylosanthes scabra TaxID=79078 RepID=A0ABU6YN22_9FABA|nr:hypothetical protein [Stylosanthes scabra]
MDSDEGMVENPRLQKEKEKGEGKGTGTHCFVVLGMKKKRPARSYLHHICAANHWRPPLFECYKQDGPSHHIMFTFKVTIEIQDALSNIIECYGAPHPKKKTAADHAADGALWYLNNIGYGINNQ